MEVVAVAVEAGIAEADRVVGATDSIVDGMTSSRPARILMVNHMAMIAMDQEVGVDTREEEEVMAVEEGTDLDHRTHKTHTLPVLHIKLNHPPTRTEIMADEVGIVGMAATVVAAVTHRTHREVIHLGTITLTTAVIATATITLRHKILTVVMETVVVIPTADMEVMVDMVQIRIPVPLVEVAPIT